MIVQSVEQLREQAEWPSWVTPGWYAATLSKAVARDEVRAIDVAGRRLALARTRGGAPVILDRYCAHQGASLAEGRVVGERIECPFHAWRYSTEGRCVEIPGCPKIPAGAAVRSYPAVDRYGFIWIFVGEPALAVRHPLPDPAQVCGTGDWFLVRAKAMAEVGTTPRDIIENVVDQGHVSTVHKVKGRTADDIVFQFSEERFHSDFTMKMFGKLMSGYTTVYAPSFWWTSLSGFGQLGSPVDGSAWLFTVLPLGPNRTRCYSASFARGPRWNPASWAVGAAMEGSWTHGFQQDVRVWRDKIVREKPLLCAADTGPVMQFRKWWSEHEARLRTPERRAG